MVHAARSCVGRRHTPTVTMMMMVVVMMIMMMMVMMVMMMMRRRGRHTPSVTMRR